MAATDVTPRQEGATMLSRKLPGIAASVGVLAAGLWVWIPPAAGGSPLEDQARYQPVQSISYEFGSKKLSGYFVQQAATCVVTLMVVENSDPEGPLPPSPARVRLVLYPGQVAGLDSAEGRSLNVTCGADAATLLVDTGETGELAGLQNRRKDFVTSE
jgi:hypothetical protein